MLFFSDDQGTLDLGCYGSDDLHTPHLDALAARGVRFTQSYTASPVCSPSRAALLTGRYPQRAGLTTNAPLTREGGMPGSQVTLAELLRDAGYRTALFGKWHLGNGAETDPNGQGFQQFFGHRVGCIDNYSHFFYWSGPHFHDLWRDRTEVHEDGKHFTELVVREARRFVRESGERPYFLYVPFNVPHYPMQPQAKYRERYASLPEPRRSYAGSITSMDAAVGEILAEIDRRGQRERTLVLFLSDHGHSTEERAGFQGGNAGPYRGAKFSLLEGGIRVPMIAAMPGRIPAGAVRDQLVTSVDLFPTVAELTGTPLPPRRIDGRSLTPVLRSRSAPSPHPVFHWQLGDQWAVRQGDWKLVVNGVDTDHRQKLQGDERVMLSNLAEDATERRTRAADYPERVRQLTELHEEWTREVIRQ
ncbi:MAG: sulfatase [Armatimonadota bacterium]